MAAGLLELGMRMAVWNKARPLMVEDPDRVRIDDYGNLIHWSEYGNRESPYGWEMDHHPLPRTLGGSDTLENLRPLHWRRNASHGGLLGLLVGRAEKIGSKSLLSDLLS